MTLRRVAAAVFGLLLVTGATTACGGSSDASPSAPSTVARPDGDPALIPVLLTAAELERGLEAGDGRRVHEDYFKPCPGVDLGTPWGSARAVMTAHDQRTDIIRTITEVVMELRAGKGAAWFARLAGCIEKGKPTLRHYVRVDGVGDEAWRTVDPDPFATLLTTIALVRVGDRVIYLVSGGGKDEVMLDDALLAKAVAKVKAG